jgi:ABC-type enterochelin transport system permease subunit
MNFIIGFILGAVVVAVCGFLIYRNNFVKIGKIAEVLAKGQFNANTAKAIEAIIKGEDCKDCK